MPFCKFGAFFPVLVRQLISDYLCVEINAALQIWNAFSQFRAITNSWQCACWNKCRSANLGHFFPFLVRQLFSVNFLVEINAVKQILDTFFLFLCNSRPLTTYSEKNAVWLILGTFHPLSYDYFQFKILFINMQICCFALLRARSSKNWIIKNSFKTLFWQSISIYRQTPEQNFANLPDPFGSYRNQLSMEDFVITQHDDKGELPFIYLRHEVLMETEG